jgi:hypothetical protein
MIKAKLSVSTGIAALLSGVALIAISAPANAQSLSSLTVTKLNTSNLVAKQVLVSTQTKPITAPVATLGTSSAAAAVFASAPVPPPASTPAFSIVNLAPNSIVNPPQGTTSATANTAVVGFGASQMQFQGVPQQPSSPVMTSSPVSSGVLNNSGFQLGAVNTTTTTTTGGGGTGNINSVLANTMTSNLAGAELAPVTQGTQVIESYHPPQGSTGPGQTTASGGEANQNSSATGGGNPGSGSGLGASSGGGSGSGTGTQGGGSSSGSGSVASNSGSGGSSSGTSSGGQTTVASLETSRGGDGSKPSCANPDGSTSCASENLANVAPTAGGSEYIVTATVAQAGDVSAGTYVFGTNADGSPRVMQTAPVVPKTVDAAGLGNVIARSSGDHSIVAGTVSQTTAANGAKQVAVDLYGDKLMSFAVDQSAATNIVDGDGKAIAPGGEGSDGKPVMMMASVAEQVVQSAINLGGLHEANGYLIRDGKLILVYLEPGQHLAALPESSPQPVQVAMRAE